MRSLFLLLFTANMSWPGGEYISSDRSFRLNVPSGYRVRTGTEKQSESYLPVCQAESTVCFEYPPKRFPGNTFDSASVEVTLLSAGTKKACIDPGKDIISENTDAEYHLDPSRSSQVIDGVTFRHTLDVGAAMSHDIEVNRYWGFDKDRCFQIATSVSYTNFGVYDKAQIKDFTKLGRSTIMNELNRIVRSFKALN